MYFNNLVDIDLVYPGLRDLLQNNGMSIQAQEYYPSRISIDQGEQTINKDAITAGGIKGFTNLIQCSQTDPRDSRVVQVVFSNGPSIDLSKQRT